MRVVNVDQIKRERRIVYDDQRLQLRVVEGDDITPELMPLAFEIYRSTIDKVRNVFHRSRSTVDTPHDG
jgi:predicted N-acyltransferase